MQRGEMSSYGVTSAGSEPVSALALQAATVRATACKVFTKHETRATSHESRLFLEADAQAAVRLPEQARLDALRRA